MRDGTFDIIMCIVFGIILPAAVPLAIWLIEELNDWIMENCKKKDLKGDVK